MKKCIAFYNSTLGFAIQMFSQLRKAILPLLFAPSLLLCQSFHASSNLSTLRVVIVDSLPTPAGEALLLLRRNPDKTILLMRRRDYNPQLVTEARRIVRRGITLQKGGAEARVSFSVRGRPTFSSAERAILLQMNAALRNEPTLRKGYGRQSFVTVAFE